MSEFLGSRISLVSKSGIRYEGTLHEINSESSTVALEGVKSFGTEGRRGNPAEEILGSDHIYEYIVFRGSDVRELNIVSPPEQRDENKRPQVPDDPAILGSARPVPPPNQQPPPPQQPDQFRGPPPLPFQQQPQQPFGYPPPNHHLPPRFQGPGGPHGFPGPQVPGPGYGMGYGMPPPPPGYGMGYGPPPGHGFPGGPPPGPFSPPQQMPIGPPAGPPMNHQHEQPAGQPQGPVVSKQGTPQPGAQNAPKPPMQHQQKPIEMSTTPAPSSSSASTPAAPPPPLDSKPSTSVTTAPPVSTEPAQQPTPATTAPRQNNRVAVPLPSPNVLAAKPPQKSPEAPRQASAPPTQPASIPDATQAATAAVAAAMAKLGVGRSSQPQNTDGTDNLAPKAHQARIQDSQPRGRGRGRGGLRGTNMRGGAPSRSIDVPKEDYDFDAANAKFNKEKLAKEATASGSQLTSPVNGVSQDPMTATNGHTHAAGEDDVVIPPKPTSEKSYDKKSSFFDNISSDLKDRVEQASSEHVVDGRALRREERSKNMETFGQGSVDGGYRGGGFRGRGRGRGYGRGGGGRGYSGRGGFEARGDSGGMRGRGRGGLEAATPPV